MSILTKAEHLEVTLGIWAIPKSPDCMEPGEFPFRYEVTNSTTCHWRSTAILVQEVKQFVQLQGGIDLYPKAHETLDLQEKEALRVYMEAIKTIGEQRSALLQITHQANDSSIIDVQ